MVTLQGQGGYMKEQIRKSNERMRATRGGWGGLMLLILLGGGLRGTNGGTRNGSTVLHQVRHVRTSGHNETGGRGVCRLHWRQWTRGIMLGGESGLGKEHHSRTKSAAHNGATTETAGWGDVSDGPRQGGTGDGGIAGGGTGAALSDVGGEEATEATIRANAGERVLRVVAVNVGGLALVGRTAGGAVGRETPGFLAGNANSNLRSLLEWMGRRRPPPAADRLIAAFVLSSTMLPRTHLPQVLTEMQGVGYVCQHTHGVPGRMRRREIAGVMVCIDAERLRFLPTGVVSRLKRVVVTGRVIMVRVGVVGATAVADFDIVGVYMPLRGSGARGHAEEEMRDHVQRVWERLIKAVLVQAPGRRLLLAGDFNAEPPGVFRADRMRQSREATPADKMLESLHDRILLVRAQKYDWTYTTHRGPRFFTTMIDHMYVTAELHLDTVGAWTVEGIERGEQRHRALELALAPSTVPEFEWGRPGPQAAKLCKLKGANSVEAFWRCRRAFADMVEQAVEEAVKAVGGWTGASPATRLGAIQTGQLTAMSLAVRGMEKLAPRDKEELAMRGATTGDQGTRRGGGYSRIRPGAGASVEDKAITALAALRRRRDLLRDAPSTLEGWRVFLPGGEGLHAGMPLAYSMFGSTSPVAMRMRHIYGGAFAKQMLGGHGGEAACEARAMDIGRTGTPTAARVLGGTGEAAGLNERSPFVSHKTVRADGQAFTRNGLINVAGLVLARRRWRMEARVVDEELPALEARAEAHDDNEAADFYANRVAEAAVRGEVESVVYGIIHAHRRGLVGQGGAASGSVSGTAISAVRRESAEGVEVLFHPREVLQAALDTGRSFSTLRPFSAMGTLRLARSDVRGREDTATLPGGHSEGEWLREVYSEERLDAALRRMRADGQAPGIDGWPGVLLRWSPRRVRLRYLDALREAAALQEFPAHWPSNLVTLIPKPGKDASILTKRRDIWNCAHGQKINTHCLRPELQRVQERVADESNRGFRPFADAGEATTPAVIQNDQAAILCEPVVRLYLDLKGFFMGIVRELLFILEAAYGVVEGVTRTMRTLQAGLQGSVRTAFGFSEWFPACSGTGQGCVLGPVKAVLKLQPVVRALHARCPGLAFEAPAGGTRWGVSQMWYADDLNIPAKDAHAVQLCFDVAWVAVWVGGDVVGIDPDGSKTAIESQVCVRDVGREIEDSHAFEAPSGERVPVLQHGYRLLGSVLDAKVGNPQARAGFVRRTSALVSALADVGGQSVTVYRKLVDSAVVGMVLHYGGPTPLRWEDTVMVEKRRTQGLCRLGHRACAGPRVQVYATTSEGGLGQVHTYAHAAAKTVMYIHKALTSQPGSGHRIAVESGIALMAHVFGFVSSEHTRTPMDWMPTYALGSLRGEYLVQAWWLALHRAGLRPRHAGGGAGEGHALDPQLRLWRPPLDGGGPNVWELFKGEVDFSVELCGAGIVRLVDLYAGKDNEGNGVWMKWPTVETYYFLNDRSTPWRARAKPAWRALEAALTAGSEAAREARAWLKWFAAWMPSSAPPPEHWEVERRRLERMRGWCCEAITAVRETGLRGEGRDTYEYLCTWAEHPLPDESTWEREASVRHYWRWHEFGSEADRVRSADEAMGRARGLRDIPPFTFRRVLEHNLGADTWDELRGARDLNERDEEVARVLDLLDRWVLAASEPHTAMRDSAEDRRRADELRWQPDGRQQLFGGHIRWTPAGPDRASASALGDGKARGGDGGGPEWTGEREESLDLNGECEGRAGQEQECSDPEGPCARDTRGGGGGEEEVAHTPVDPGEEWPEDTDAILADTKLRRRIPSLSASSHVEADKMAALGRVQRLDVDELRRALRHDRPGVIWWWKERSGQRLRWEGDPVVRVLDRASELDHPWASGGDYTRRVLFRGLTGEEGERVRAGEGIGARGHTGGIAQHVRDIAEGSRVRTAGISLSKDPCVAVRYSASEEDGMPVCVSGPMLEASGHGRDFSTTAGQATLRAAGAPARALAYAAADGEWRHEMAIPATAVRRDATGPMRLVPAEAAWEGDLRAAKAAYCMTLPPAARDAVADWAAKCEGWPQAARAEPGGPALRLDWAEGRTMSARVSRSIAHMAVTLHGEYEFTDACSTDGSLNDDGEAAFGVWRGRRGQKGGWDAEGGGLEKGASIQDAELLAIEVCSKGAEVRRHDSRGAPRLLVLSDCLSVLVAIEKAWRQGSAWKLYTSHRSSTMESILLRRRAWQQRQGAMVFLWIPSHAGIFPNAYADAVAKAYLGRPIPADITTAPTSRVAVVGYVVSGPTGRGGEGWMATDRTVLKMVTDRLQKYVLHRLARESSHLGGLVIDLPDACPGAWPWRSRWRAVLRACGEAGPVREPAGSRGRKGHVGLIMSIRSGQLGVASDTGEPGGAAQIEGLREILQGGQDTQGVAAGVRLGRALAGLLVLVDTPTGSGEFTEAVRLAAATVVSLRIGGEGEVDERDWWRTRAVVSGALPALTPREKAEGMRAVLGLPAGARTELDDGQLKEGKALLEAAVIRAVNAASNALGEAAREWRRVHNPRWTDVVPGDRGDGPGAGDEDGANDMGGDTSEDSGDEGSPDTPVGRDAQGEGGRNSGRPAEGTDTRGRQGEGERQPYPYNVRTDRGGGVALNHADRGTDRPTRKERSDKGVARGPRAIRGKESMGDRRTAASVLPQTTEGGERHPNGRKRRRDAGVVRGPRGSATKGTGPPGTAERTGRGTAATDTMRAARKQRVDKGVRRGPRQAGADAAGLVGYVSLFRYRHGVARQVPEGMLDQLSASPRPWASVVRDAEATPGTHPAGGAPGRHRRREAITPPIMDFDAMGILDGVGGSDRRRDLAARRGDLFKGAGGKASGTGRRTRDARRARARERARAALLESQPVAEEGRGGTECDLDILTAATWAEPGETNFRRALARVGTTACTYD